MANDFFTQIETEQQKKLASFMASYNGEPLKANQRIKQDRRTGLVWLEERKRTKDYRGWHTYWYRIALIEG